MTEQDTSVAAIKMAIALFAEMRHRPTHVNQKQAAEMLHLSQPTVGKLVRAGVLPLNDCGMIPIEAVDAARDAKAA